MRDNPSPDAARDELHLQALRNARLASDEIAAREALGQLLAPYWESTRTIAYSKLQGVPDRAAEATRIAQDLMVRLIGALSKRLEFDAPFHAVVAVNRRWAIDDFWREYLGEEARSHDPAELPDLVGASEAEEPATEQARAFEPYLAGLTTRERDLVIERIFLDMTPEQIAAKHGMTRNAVDVAYHRALEKLRANRPHPDVRKHGEGAA